MKAGRGAGASAGRQLDGIKQPRDPGRRLGLVMQPRALHEPKPESSPAEPIEEALPERGLALGGDPPQDAVMKAGRGGGASAGRQAEATEESLDPSRRLDLVAQLRILREPVLELSHASLAELAGEVILRAGVQESIHGYTVLSPSLESAARAAPAGEVAPRPSSAPP